MKRLPTVKGIFSFTFIITPPLQRKREHISDANLGMCPTPPFLTATACISLILPGSCIHSNTSLCASQIFCVAMHVMPIAYESY